VVSLERKKNQDARIFRNRQTTSRS